MNRDLVLLMPFDNYNTIFIDTLTNEPAKLDIGTETALGKVLHLLKDHARTEYLASTPLILNVATSVATSLIGEATRDQDHLLRNFMITITGILLEYPFTYYTSPESLTNESGRVMTSRRLVFVELQLTSSSIDKIQSVIKFSVPQAFGENNRSIFEQSLVSSKSTYQARLAAANDVDSRHESLVWRVSDNVKEADVVL